MCAVPSGSWGGRRPSMGGYVTVTGPTDGAAPPERVHVDHPRGQAFWRRGVVRKPVYVPSILLIIMRALELGGIAYKNARRKIADVYLTPDLLPFKRTDFHSADQIAEVGYRVATDEVGAWGNSSAKLAARRPDLVRSAPAFVQARTATGGGS